MPERNCDRLKTRNLLRILFFIIVPSLLKISPAFSQEPEEGDTLLLQADEAVVVEDTFSRDPQRAALYSAILPGLGQIYNKKYWKLPIVYGGFGTFIYFIDRNTRYYQDLKQKIIDPEYDMKYFEGNYSTDQLRRGMDLYKRWRDLSIIGTAGFYVLQIIDATVDAYLFDWDVGEDISLRIKPDATPVTRFVPYNSFGLSACISF
jgi:hypothetical protein